MEKVSGDGVITIEESKTMQTELDLVEGMQFDRGYISAYMATDMDKMEATLGPNVTLTVSASLFTPVSNVLRASAPYLISFAMIQSSSNFKYDIILL